MTESKIGDFLRNRNGPPMISPRMANSVSQVRRTMLEEEMNKGLYRESQYQAPGFSKGANYDDTPLGAVVGSMRKFANTSGSGSAGGDWRGSGGTLRQVPEIYSPLWLNSNLNLPRDRATINAWSRAFFALNAYVRNAISLHATYPISKLNIKCKNKKVEKFFAEMIEELNLINICVQIAQEYWILGEAFVYAEMDESTAKWSRILIQNPDYITVKNTVVADEPIISLRPDENLKRIVTSQRPQDVMQRQKLDRNIIEHVRRGENIPLSNFYVTHLANKIAPYETRGTGIIVSAFRPLMLFDQLRESKFAQASNMVNPLTLIKIGSAEHKPSFADLEAYREQFEAAQYDKDFKIFTHNDVMVERVGYNQGILDTSNDVDRLIKEIYIALMVPSVLMDGGADTTYANGGVALDVLRQRYMQFRNMLALFLRRKIFAPIAKINDFYDYEDGKKVLLVPDIDWNHMSLFDMGDYIQNISQLASGEQKKVSVQTLYRSLGLDYTDEKKKLREEQIDEIILMKEKENLSRMPLNEIRALGPDDEIPEILESLLPGESPFDAGGQPGMDMGMGLPGVPPPPMVGMESGGMPAPPAGGFPPGPPGGAPPEFPI